MELRRLHSLHVSRNCTDLLIVWSSLQSWEDSIVDLLGQIPFIFAGEDNTGTGSLKRLVRGRHNDISVVKRSVLESTSDESTNVAHIGEQVGIDAVANLTELVILQLTRVGRSACHDKIRAELYCFPGKGIVVNEHGFTIAVVLLALPEVRRSGDFASRRIEAVGQVATFSKRHTHQTLTRWDQRRVNGKVCRATRETLNIDGPLIRVKLVGIKGALLS